MKKLTIEDLYTLEAYAQKRSSFQQKVLLHKRNRRLPLGDHVTLYFEDRLTMHYQVQEMLRIERICTADEIAEELATYNPLIPDGTNWKATLMLEYEDKDERSKALQKLVGIEHKIWLQVDGHKQIFPYADEDLTRERGNNKTSAVHFLRFELSPEMLASFKANMKLRVGIVHEHYRYECEVAKIFCESLNLDLD